MPPKTLSGAVRHATCTLDATEPDETLAASELLPLVYDELRRARRAQACSGKARPNP